MGGEGMWGVCGGGGGGGKGNGDRAVWVCTLNTT